MSVSGLRFAGVRVALLIAFLTLLGFAVAQSAFIQVRAAVGIQVFVDDVFVGVTNADVGGLIVSDVRVGSRRLRFVLEGFLPQEQTVTVAAGQVLLVEVGSLVPRVQVREEGAGGAAELRVATGSVVVQCLPIECVVDVPALGITNRRKTQDRLVIEGVPVGAYSGRLMVGSVAFPVSFDVCGGDTTALFGTFVGATPGVTVTSAAGLGVGCSRGSVTLAPPTPMIAAGWFHSLALRSDGTVWTWGSNQYGQLGDGSTTDRSIPVRVMGF